MRLGILAFACSLLLGVGVANADDRHHGGRGGRGDGWRDQHRHYDRGDHWRNRHYRGDPRYYRRYDRGPRRPVVVLPPAYYPQPYYYAPPAGLSFYIPFR